MFLNTLKKYNNLLVYTSFLFLISSCTIDDGHLIDRRIELDSFDKIIVYEGIKLVIHNSETPYAIVKSNENRIEDTTFNIIDNTLHIKGRETNLFTASYTPVEVHLYTPTLTEIRQSGNYTIHSEEPLEFPVLFLISENYNGDYINVGDFNLTINNDFLMVASNGVSNIIIEGHTKSLELNYYSGTGIFDGKALTAETVTVFHRGANTLKVFPLDVLKGNIYSVGNLEAYNRPNYEEVTQHYTGRLIYKD